MSDLNRICLTGRLTRDPEVRTMPSGGSVCHLRIAVNGRDDHVDFIDVSAFAKTADVLGRFLTKGSRISVDGRISHREWEAKDGTKRSGYEVVGQHVGFLDPRPQRAEEALSGAEGEDAGGHPQVRVTDVAAPTPGGDDRDDAIAPLSA